MKRRLLNISLVLACAATPLVAEVNRLQNDFTFKRIGIPPAGQTTGRITVQIAPRPPSSPSGPPVAGTGGAIANGSPIAGATPRTGNLDWFWLAVSPKIEDSKPGRLIMALDALDDAPSGQEVTEPRLQALQQIAQTHGRDILRETIGTNVSPALVLAVIAVESAGDHSAESRAGAQGLMQLMPATAARFGVSNSLDPVDNIKGGVAYLDWLMNEFDGDPVLFLAGYNAGEGSVRDAGGVPNYAETRAYVPKVLSAWKVARALCVTPPELMTDGCVFSTGL